jgi:hypothetical protein
MSTDIEIWLRNPAFGSQHPGYRGKALNEFNTAYPGLLGRGCCRTSSGVQGSRVNGITLGTNSWFRVGLITRCR